MPTRLLPKGWFRQRGVAKEFAKELKAELGVDMIFKQQWYFQKLMLAFALWAIAIGFLVATLVRKGSFVLQTGGYVTIGGAAGRVRLLGCARGEAQSRSSTSIDESARRIQADRSTNSAIASDPEARRLAAPRSRATSAVATVASAAVQPARGRPSRPQWLSSVRLSIAAVPLLKIGVVA